MQKSVLFQMLRAVWLMKAKVLVPLVPRIYTKNSNQTQDWQIVFLPISLIVKKSPKMASVHSVLLVFMLILWICVQMLIWYWIAKFTLLRPFARSANLIICCPWIKSLVLQRGIYTQNWTIALTKSSTKRLNANIVREITTSTTQESARNVTLPMGVSNATIYPLIGAWFVHQSTSSPKNSVLVLLIIQTRSLRSILTILWRLSCSYFCL